MYWVGKERLMTMGNASVRCSIKEEKREHGKGIGATIWLGIQGSLLALAGPYHGQVETDPDLIEQMGEGLASREKRGT